MLGIGDIAFANGFKSEAHFSRAFLARFGLNPSEVRRLATSRAVQAGSPDYEETAADTLADWVRELGRGNPAP